MVIYTPLRHVSLCILTMSLSDIDYLFDNYSLEIMQPEDNENFGKYFDGGNMEWLFTQLDSTPDSLPGLEDSPASYVSPDSVSSDNDDAINGSSTLPSLSWCIKSGKIKPHNFWAYCELKQSNYIKFAFSNPHFTITNNSRFVFDTGGKYIVVENIHETLTKAFYLHDISVCITVDTHAYTKISNNDIGFKLQVICDNEEPVHPHQGEASYVKIDVECLEDSNIKNVLPKPFGMFFKLNLIGRVEGFFKVECSLYHKNQIILSTHSDTFMMNDPRVKKKPQHKLFSCKELKFMRLCSLDKQKNMSHDTQHWINVANSLHLNNPINLINQSYGLFPKCVRTGKRERPRDWKFNDSNPQKIQKK